MKVAVQLTPPVKLIKQKGIISCDEFELKVQLFSEKKPVNEPNLLKIVL
jgi:hypothetical protein